MRTIRKGSESTRTWREVIDACYQPAPTDDDWVKELLAAAAPLLDHGLGLGFSLFDEAPEGRLLRIATGRGEMAEPFHGLSQSAVTLDASAYRAMYYPKTLVVRASTAFRASVGSAAFLREAARHIALVDALGLLIYPRPNSVGVLTAFMPARASLAGNLRDRLHLLRQHVEAGLRLRVRHLSEPLMVLCPDGKIVHAAGRMHDPNIICAVSDRVRHIDGARAIAGGPRATWQALLQGRWSLVPRTEADGRRFYHVYENAPHVQRHQALTARETEVTQRLLRGTSAKVVALELGLSSASVSRTLASALLKLGLRSETELFRIGARLWGGGNEVKVALTSAEYEVYRLLLDGRSNAEVAWMRNASVHTVAKQVASVLRKTGVPSRRALCTLAIAVGEAEPAGDTTSPTFRSTLDVSFAQARTQRCSRPSTRPSP